MSVNTLNINIVDSDGVNSSYRCEVRDKEYSTFFAERVPGINTVWCESEEDSMYIARGRHRVYSYGNNHLDFTSRLSRKSARARQSGIPAAEVRLYKPVNAIEEDMMIVVSTVLDGMYIQLYGGLYSECEMNSYEVIRDNHETYSEYVYFKIPLRITYVQYPSLTITLVPVESLNGGRYLPSEKYTLNSVSFTKESRLDLRARLELCDGLLSVKVRTDIAKKEFERDYKHLGHGPDRDAAALIEDSYNAKICLYEGPGRRDDFLLATITYGDVTQGPSDYLIDKTFSLLEGTSRSGTYSNLQINMLGEKVYGTHQMTWENVPEALVAVVEIEYRCANAYGEEMRLEFVSNEVPILKDNIKYLIDKPTTASMDLFFDDFTKYQQEHMLHINITNVIEDNSPQAVPVSTQTPQTLFKPVFFRAQPVSAINIVSGISQRVGINLQEYETKVTCFSIRIGDRTFTERERTDMYVIFKIDASLLKGDETQFHVLDQDMELITSGKINMQ